MYRYLMKWSKGTIYHENGKLHLNVLVSGHLPTRVFNASMPGGCPIHF